MTSAARELLIRAVPGVPMVVAGDDLAAIIADALDAAGMALRPGDVLVIAQTVVSKAEDRLVPLAGVTPSARAAERSAEHTSEHQSLMRTSYSDFCLQTKNIHTTQ